MVLEPVPTATLLAWLAVASLPMAVASTRVAPEWGALALPPPVELTLTSYDPPLPVPFATCVARLLMARLVEYSCEPLTASVLVALNRPAATFWI